MSNENANQGAAAPHMQLVIDVLEAARAQVVKGWTRYTNARDEYGKEVRSADPLAVKWCMVGALISVADSRDERYAAEHWLARACHSAPETFNDSWARTQGEVVDAYDKAISLARDAAPAAPKEPQP